MFGGDVRFAEQHHDNFGDLYGPGQRAQSRNGYADSNVRDRHDQDIQCDDHRDTPHLRERFADDCQCAGKPVFSVHRNAAERFAEQGCDVGLVRDGMFGGDVRLAEQRDDNLGDLHGPGQCAQPRNGYADGDFRVRHHQVGRRNNHRYPASHFRLSFANSH